MSPPFFTLQLCDRNCQTNWRELLIIEYWKKSSRLDGKFQMRFMSLLVNHCWCPPKLHPIWEQCRSIFRAATFSNWFDWNWLIERIDSISSFSRTNLNIRCSAKVHPSCSRALCSPEAVAVVDLVTHPGLHLDPIRWSDRWRVWILMQFHKVLLQEIYIYSR